MAASSQGNALLVGCDGEENGDAIAVFRLDGDGEVVAESPERVELPRPDALDQVPLRTLEVLAHPELPVVYVWRDAAALPDEQDERTRIRRHLDHLLVYRIETDGTLVLLQRTAQGQHIGLGRREAAMAVDATRRRLFLPNFKGKNADGDFRPQIGHVPLLEDGRVKLVEGRAEFRGDFGGGVLSWRYGWPYFYLQLQDNRMILGTDCGVALWMPDHSLAQFYRYSFGYDASHLVFASLHPEVPVLYAMSHGRGRVYGIRLAAGRFTLLPQRLEVAGRDFLTAPIVLAKENRVVVAERNRVVALAIDEEGWLTGGIRRIDLPSFRGRAITYSSGFGKLYAVTDTPWSKEGK